ncbi:MAG: hypothetical protein KDK63_03140, partial [Chlamydiia bacterium]|nr:hypothetical protein [Chlamydiia bacterium]
IGAKIIDHKKLEKKTSYFQYFIDCIRSPFHQGVYSGQAKGKGGEGSPPSSGIKSEFDKKI